MNKKNKIAVVGIGLMGSQHLKALQLSKKATLHSVVDLNKSSRKHAEKF
jgi:predicted dehydrogenase